MIIIINTNTIKKPRGEFIGIFGQAAIWELNPKEPREPTAKPSDIANEEVFHFEDKKINESLDPIGNGTPGQFKDKIDRPDSTRLKTLVDMHHTPDVIHPLNKASPIQNSHFMSSLSESQSHIGQKPRLQTAEMAKREYESWYAKSLFAKEKLQSAQPNTHAVLL